MLEVSHVAKSYGRRTILRDISFTAEPGEQIALIGRNGCGKSTLLRMLAGIDPIAEGEVFFFGNRAGRDRSVFREFSGYLPQDNPLLGDLSVEDNISLWSGRSGRPDDWLVREFQLDGILKQRTDRLSGGQRRRAAIACACAGQPPVLFLDEPTASLDIEYKRDFRAWMRSYRERNGILVIATHDIPEMEDSSRILLMENGVLEDVTGRLSSVVGSVSGLSASSLSSKERPMRERDTLEDGIPVRRQGEKQ